MYKMILILICTKELLLNYYIYILAASPLAACSQRHIGPTTAALAPLALDSVFTKVLECQ